MIESHQDEPPEPNGNSYMQQSVETIDCTTLDQFWNRVSPIGEFFGQRYTSFIFRGQRDSEGRWFQKCLGRMS